MLEGKRLWTCSCLVLSSPVRFSDQDCRGCHRAMSMQAGSQNSVIPPSSLPTVSPSCSVTSNPPPVQSPPASPPPPPPTAASSTWRVAPWCWQTEGWCASTSSTRCGQRTGWVMGPRGRQLLARFLGTGGLACIWDRCMSRLQHQTLIHVLWECAELATCGLGPTQPQ